MEKSKIQIKYVTLQHNRTRYNKREFQGIPFMHLSKKEIEENINLRLCYQCKKKRYTPRDCKYDKTKTDNKVENPKKKTTLDLKFMEEDDVGHAKTICVIDMESENKTNKSNLIQRDVGAGKPERQKKEN
jgi:hypothetical protein